MSRDPKNMGVRYWTERAVSHASGIIESQDDESFWGSDFTDGYLEEFYTDKNVRDRSKARRIIMNRIEGGRDR